MVGKSNQTRPEYIHALMPGSRISKHGSKITLNVGTSNETIVFNIGGTRYETFRSTLHGLPNSPLADHIFLQRHYIAEKDEYFFDRDPEVFKAILQYLRTGELHIASSSCSSAVKTELEFWGVEEIYIEDCCWFNYNSWSQTLKSLKKMEDDRKKSTCTTRHQHKLFDTKWTKFKKYGWNFLNDPHWNVGSKIYGSIAILFICLSIFSYVAQTHEYFQTHHSFNNTNHKNSSQFYSDWRSPTIHVHPTLFMIDCVCFVFFLSEFILRVICCPHKLGYFTNSMNIVDLLALIPDFIVVFATWFGGFPTAVTSLNTFVAVFKITRVLRIIRLMKFFPGLWLLFYTMRASFYDLLNMLLFVIIGVLIFSSLIYYVEERDNFPDIPRAFWWAIITMTTVGYGDVSPKTNLGYLVGSIASICGPLLIGFTVPILVNNFILYYNHTQCALEREKRKEERYKQNKRQLKSQMSIEKCDKKISV